MASAMKPLILIFAIYISFTLCFQNDTKANSSTKKHKPYVNGKIILRAGKYEKSAKINTVTMKPYTVFEIVGKPRELNNVHNSVYFPIERTQDLKSRILKELTDYPWSILREKRSAVLEVAPLDTKKAEPIPSEAKKVEQATPTRTQATPAESSSTQKVSHESSPVKNITKATPTTNAIVKRSPTLKPTAKTARKNEPLRKKGKTKAAAKNKNVAAVRAKPKGKQTKPASNVRAKKTKPRINKAAKKKPKKRQRPAPQRSKKPRQSNKKQKSRSGKAPGRQNPKETRRLTAAREARIEDYPYVVSIQKNKEHWCSGALLNPRLVITTANCVWKANRMSRMEVRAGSRHTDHGGQKVGIQEVIKHPRWGLRKNPDNDVALLLLDANIKFSDSVHGVDLPNRVMMPPFDDAWITSWGAERRDGIYDPTYTNSLQVYHSRLINKQKCNNITMRFSVVVTENFICLAQSGRHAPCTRDTGAPAVSDGILWGLASWGLRKLCGTERFPAMFSYLASHTNVDFITNATRFLMSDTRQYPFPDRYPMGI